MPASRMLWPNVALGAAVAGSLGLLTIWLGVMSRGQADTTQASIVLLAPIMLVYAALGWLILRLRPGHRVGWVLLSAPLVAAGAFGGIGLGGTVLQGLSRPLAGAVGTIGISLILPTGMMFLCILPLLFPDGHLPGPRWRRPSQAVVAVTGLATACFVLAPGQLDPGQAANPFGIAGLEILVAIGSVLSAIAVPVGGLLGLASMVVRFRRGRGEERQQMKWMLGAVAVVLAANVPGFVGIYSSFLDIAGSLSVLLLPVAMTLAILRYRLYEIDRLFSRTIAWALLTLSVVAVFVGGNLALQAVLENMTQGDTIAVAGSTLLALAVAQPIWHRLQRAVDRRFDRARFDAAETATAFAGRQRQQVQLEAVLGDLALTTEGALRPAAVSVWLRTRQSPAD